MFGVGFSHPTAIIRGKDEIFLIQRFILCPEFFPVWNIVEFPYFW